MSSNNDDPSKSTAIIDTGISGLDHAGITVRGYNLMDLVANAEFEEVAHLLLHHDLPTSDQYRQFKIRLRSKRTDISPKIKNMLNCFDGQEHPLNVAIACFSLMASPDDGEFVSKAEQAVAVYSTILANHIAKRRNKSTTFEVRTDLNHVNYFCHQVGIEGAVEKEVLSKLLIGASEFSFPPSTFAGRLAASVRSDFFTSLSAATAVWSGYRHGAASEHAHNQLDELVIGRDTISSFYSRKKEGGIPLFGFGHRVYKSGKDPRNTALHGVARRVQREKGGRFLEIADEVIETVAERYDLHPNADFYCACIFDALGFEADEIPSILFMGRLVGISSHIIESYDSHRSAISPRAVLYTGENGKKYTPLDRRE